MSEVESFSVPPRPELTPFVETIWGVRGLGPWASQAVVPSGAVELMVNFGPVQEVVGRGDRTLRESYKAAWLAGIHDRRLVHCSALGADHIAARFRPGGAHAFFHLPMDDAANQVLELDLVIGDEARGLRDRLGAIDGDAARAEALQDWLVERRRVRDGFPLVDRAIGLLGQGGSRAPVAAVCDSLGISNKHLVDQFRRIVGLPPKALGRILRFQGVLAACRGRSQVDWCDLAYGAGYADQSHLIREFRKLAGVTPTEFLARASVDASYPVEADR